MEVLDRDKKVQVNGLLQEFLTGCSSRELKDRFIILDYYLDIMNDFKADNINVQESKIYDSIIKVIDVHILEDNFLVVVYALIKKVILDRFKDRAHLRLSVVRDLTGWSRMEQYKLRGE